MERSPKIAEEALRAVEILKRGGVILYPTDTVWGIGCDACRPEAVRRIFEIKRRIDSKALITLVGSTRMLEKYVEFVPEVAYELIDVAVTPLTIVYDHGCNMSAELMAPDGSVGIRVTHDPFCQAMLRALRRPIVSTSANISGMPTPMCFREISPEIIKAVDYVVGIRHNEEPSTKASTVIKLTDSAVITILRK